MWQQLSVLALCGMSALRADVCEGLPTGPSTGSGSPFYEDLGAPPPVSFRLSVKDGGPTFRITIRPVSFDSLRHNRDPNVVHAGDIEVARCQDGKRLQLLPIMAWQPLNFGATFHAEDINFDGFLDFSVVTEVSGANGDIRSYWVYDPGTGIFIQNEFTHELRCGSVAVTSKYGGAEGKSTNYGDSIGELTRACLGAAFIDFDPEKREIGRRYFDGAMGGCPNTSQGK